MSLRRLLNRKKKHRSLDQLVEKLRLIVLTSAPLAEIPAPINALFDLWRRLTRGTISRQDANTEAERLGFDALDLSAMKILWEPLSDGVGDPITPQGWNINATQYLLNGQIWWLVRADRGGLLEPTPAEDAALSTIVERLGADAKRDLIKDMRFQEARWSRYFTWFHTGPLYEMHIHKTTRDFRIVVEGTPLPSGYEREGRIDANAIKR